MKTIKKSLKLLSSILFFFILFTTIVLDPFQITNNVRAAGETEIYYLQDLYDVRNDLTGSYLLMNNLDFDNNSSYDQTDPDWTTKKTSWTTGDGWVPIGTDDIPFSGFFNGQQYTISNLFMDRTKTEELWVYGLFSSNEGSISNLGVESVNINGDGDLWIGGLVGYNFYGDISNSYVTGIVSGSSSTTVTIGGLVGFNQAGEITDSHFTGSVIGGENSSSVGGLVGYSTDHSYPSNIQNCYSTGSVTGMEYIGGLVGYNASSNIQDSYSTSTVNGLDYSYSTGGFAGYNRFGTIINSYATGDVNGSILDGSYDSGGLLGGNDGTVTNSYSTGNVTGYEDVGGFSGYDYGNISNSYSTGSVTGNTEVGGFIGYDDEVTVTNSYSMGDVIGDTDVGGFIGYGYGNISNSYSTGSVTGNTEVGGFIGYNDGVTLTDSYWDTDTSNLDTSPAGVGKTTSEMQTLSTFSTWDISLIGDFDELDPTTWFIDASIDYPRLFMQYVASEDPEDPQLEEETDPTISTNAAIGITTNSSELKGDIIDLGSYESINVYFQYKKSLNSVWINTTSSAKSTLGETTYSLTNLDPNSKYDFRFVIEYGSEEVLYGDVKSFTTTKITLPKVVITDIGLIDDVLDLDNMLYYFTSEIARIKGNSYKNTHVKFVTEDEEFETDADSNGNFNITLELPRGTNNIEYYAYNDFGSQSETRTLTLVIGEENFPPNNEEVVEEEEIPEEPENENDENIEDDEDQEEEKEIQTITFTDENGDPLSGAEIEIEGETYTTNERGEIETDILSEGIHTAKITYNGKTYTAEILATKTAHIEIVVAVENNSINWKTILIISGIALIFLILLIIFFKRKKEEEENSNYTN
jgi:hypothetical protein